MHSWRAARVSETYEAHRQARIDRLRQQADNHQAYRGARAEHVIEVILQQVSP